MSLSDNEKVVVANFIKEARPALEKLASLERRIAVAVDSLIDAGLVEAHMKSAKVRQLRDNPNLLCDLPGQILTATKVASVGSVSADTEDTVSEDTPEDVFRRAILRR